LPNMQRLRARGARFLLDHGRDRYTTLGWEQVSTGRTPATGGRWSPITFDRSSYGVSQEPAQRAPFLEELAAQVLGSDLPHCDLSRTRRVRGLTNWGTHEGGTIQMANPDGLKGELAARIGPYPAAKYLYGMLWQSPEKTRLAADALARAAAVRAEAA